jgi:dUTP pyrophosphatase
MVPHGVTEDNGPSGPVVKLRALAPEVQVPVYASSGAAGADVRAWLAEPVRVEPGQRVLVPTGLHAEIPPGYEMQVRSRSGLAIKHGLFVVNSPGTIDSDYRGEIKVIIGNIGHEAITVMPGERIAQLVVAPVAQAVFCFVDGLDDTPRGQGGFGSTGR